VGAREACRRLRASVVLVRASKKGPDHGRRASSRSSVVCAALLECVCCFVLFKFGKDPCDPKSSLYFYVSHVSANSRAQLDQPGPPNMKPSEPSAPDEPGGAAILSSGSGCTGARCEPVKTLESVS